MYLQFKFAADGIDPTMLGSVGKTVMKGIPVIIFISTMNFPAVSLIMGLHSNFLSNNKPPFFRQLHSIGSSQILFQSAKQN